MSAYGIRPDFHCPEFWVVAYDGGGRPEKTDEMFPSQQAAEQEALSRNREQMERGGELDAPFMRSKSPGAMTWRQWFDSRVT